MEKKEKFELTEVDMEAVGLMDDAYINNKGAKLYTEDTYDKAVEYYRLAAAMGNVHSISNLGYCYLYGRSIEPNVSLAIAYFKVAAMREDIDAAYKLGDIYSRDEWGVKDKEKAEYYFRMAASYAMNEGWEGSKQIIWTKNLHDYPSLCYALGRALHPMGDMITDIDSSYQFLLHAKSGYEEALQNGNDMYKESYEGVLELLKDQIYDNVREENDGLFNSYYHLDEDE